MKYDIFFLSFYFQNWLTAWIYLSKAALPYVPSQMALEHIGKSVNGEGGEHIKNSNSLEIFWL